MERQTINRYLKGVRVCFILSNRMEVHTDEKRHSLHESHSEDTMGSIQTHIDILENCMSRGSLRKSAFKTEELSLLDESTCHLHMTIDALKRQIQVERMTYRDRIRDKDRLQAQVHTFKSSHKTLQSQRNTYRNELADSLGQNAELAFRTKKLRQAIHTSQNEVVNGKENTKKALKDISEREAKIRTLAQTQSRYKLEIDHLKQQYLEEKLEKAELYRSLQVAQAKSQRDTAAVYSSLKFKTESNETLQLCISELQAQVEQEKVKSQENLRLAKKEKEILVVSVMQLQANCKRNKETWKAIADASMASELAQRQSANAITLQRYVDENHALRKHVKHIEHELEVLQKENTTADKCRRRMEGTTSGIVGLSAMSKSSTLDFVALKSRVTELESLLLHSKGQQEEYKCLLLRSEAALQASDEVRNVRLVEDITLKSQLLSEYSSPSPNKPSLRRSSRNSPTRKGGRRIVDSPAAEDIIGTTEMTKLKISKMRLTEEVSSVRSLLAGAHDEIEKRKKDQLAIRALIIKKLKLDGRSLPGEMALPAFNRLLLFIEGLEKGKLIHRKSLQAEVRKRSQMLSRKGVKLECGTYLLANVHEFGRALLVSAFKAEEPDTNYQVLVHMVRLKLC